MIQTIVRFEHKARAEESDGEGQSKTIHLQSKAQVVYAVRVSEMLRVHIDEDCQGRATYHEADDHAGSDFENERIENSSLAEPTLRDAKGSCSLPAFQSSEARGTERKLGPQ